MYLSPFNINLDIDVIFQFSLNEKKLSMKWNHEKNIYFFKVFYFSVVRCFRTIKRSLIIHQIQLYEFKIWKGKYKYYARQWYYVIYVHMPHLRVQSLKQLHTWLCKTMILYSIFSHIIHKDINLKSIGKEFARIETMLIKLTIR